MARQSYNSLKEDLIHANQEARGYLTELTRLREDVKGLDKKLKLVTNDYKLFARLSLILMKVLEQYQNDEVEEYEGS